MPHHSHASDTRYHAKSRLYRRRGTRWVQLSMITESDPWLPSALLPYLSRSLRLSPMRIYLSDCKTSTHATSLSDGSSYTPSAYRSYCRNNDSSRTKHTDCCHNHYKPNRSYSPQYGDGTDVSPSRPAPRLQLDWNDTPVRPATRHHASRLRSNAP